MATSRSAGPPRSPHQRRLSLSRLLLERGGNPNEPEPGIAASGGTLQAAIGGNPDAEVESSGNCLSMAKFAGASKEMVDLIASHGGVLGAGMADLETLAAMLQANPQLPVEEKLDNPRMMKLILRLR